MTTWLTRIAGALVFSLLAARAADQIVVTGHYDPIPLEEADRNIRTFDLSGLRLVTNTFADLLKLDSSLDLRQRGPNGLQGDLSIRGGGFGQTLVLLDGLRLNDVQSGHLSLDFPLPLESVSRLEILKGSGSTLYGSDAVGGVVNFITTPPESSEIRLRTAVGNFGTNQQQGVLIYAGQRATQQFSFSRDFSTGFRPNRDYRNLSFASISHLSSKLGTTDITLANNDRPYGADQFYGNFNSWERTKTWFASIRQSIGQKTDFSMAFRRHTDLFVLYRDRPQVFTNRHATETYQVALRRREEFGQNIKLHYGAESYRDAIASNNLGQHDRARGAVYGAVDIRALRRFSFSAGVRDEIYSSLNHQWSPTVSAAAWLRSTLKFRTSVSRAFRLPTYTDLYYHDPANTGSPNLRPERAWSYEAGLDWTPNSRVQAELTVFQRRETDGIDYVRRFPTDIWRATNYQDLRFTGIESIVRTKIPGGHNVEFTYTGLRGAQDGLAGLLSKYAFNYPEHQGIVSWQASLPAGIVARSRVGALKRFSRDPYAVWDLYAASSRGRFRPFVQFSNLTATQFQEIPGVAMPGRSIIAGFELVVFRSH